MEFRKLFRHESKGIVRLLEAYVFWDSNTEMSWEHKLWNLKINSSKKFGNIMTLSLVWWFLSQQKTVS